MLARAVEVVSGVGVVRIARVVGATRAIGALATIGANSRARDSQNGDNQLHCRLDTPLRQLRSRTIFPVNCPVAINFSASS